MDEINNSALQEVCHTVDIPAKCCMFIRYAVTPLEAYYHLPRTNSSMHHILRPREILSHRPMSGQSLELLVP